MARKRPIAIRIREAREKLERLKDEEQMDKIKNRMMARKQQARAHRRRL